MWLEAQGLTNWRDYFRPEDNRGEGRRGAWELPEAYHYSTWTAERTIAFMEAQDAPFFCWASFHDPHPPYLVPEPWASMYDPDEMVPGELTPGEHDRNPPHFGKTQEQEPDFSAYRETPYPNHGFSSHLADDAQARQDMAIYYGMISLMDQGCYPGG